jgi:hypothetical protein
MAGRADMTDDKMQTLKDDIAFMTALAREGSSTPLLFGGVMVSAGVIFGAGAVGHWAIVSGLLDLSPWYIMANWVAAGAVFALTLALLLGRSRGRPGASAGVNKATGAAWSAVGFAIFTCWLGMTVIGLVTGDWAVMNVFPVLILALYGAAWFVAGTLTGKGWIKLTALTSFAAAVGMGALTGHPLQMLGYAACLALVTIAPGLILMRQEPTDIV